MVVTNNINYLIKNIKETARDRQSLNKIEHSYFLELFYTPAIRSESSTPLYTH